MDPRECAEGSLSPAVGPSSQPSVVVKIFRGMREEEDLLMLIHLLKYGSKECMRLDYTCELAPSHVFVPCTTKMEGRA